MSAEKIKLLDRTGQSLEQEQDLWPALVITKEEIDAEIERLAAMPRPAHGRRESLFGSRACRCQLCLLQLLLRLPLKAAHLVIL